MTSTTGPLAGKVALVTGGSRGIGAAIARRLGHDGADVALTYRSGAERAVEVAAAITATGRRALTVEADSADPGEPARTVARVLEVFGRLDIVVNNAGVSVQGPLDTIGPDDVDRTLAVNVRAPFLLAQAAAAVMGRGGRIVSIGSNAIERTPFPGMSLYSLSKSSLLGLTKGLARDLGPAGITVNLVSPGPVDTEMNPADGPHAAAVNASMITGRYGTAEEVAVMVAYLVGGDAGNVTGANLAIDGGITV